MTWDDPTAEWWVGEVTSDVAYGRDVDPLLEAVLPVAVTGPVADLGCGEGRLHRHASLGIDRSPRLASVASARLPVAVADVVDLPFGDGALRGAFSVLVLEHVPDASAFFEEAARVVGIGGWLAVVINHPFWTAPGSGPFLDPADGEVLWRWGGYLTGGHSDEPVDGGSVRFHHRSFGMLLSAAARAGWSLEQVEERPLEPGDDPLLALQAGVPRLMAARWRRVSQHGGGLAE